MPFLTPESSDLLSFVSSPSLFKFGGVNNS